MLVAHVHPAGYAVVVLAFGNQLVEGASGKEVAAETLERLHLPVDGHEVEGVAVAMRRGGRAAYCRLALHVQQAHHHLVGAFLRGVAYHPHRSKPFGAAVGTAEVFLQAFGVVCQYLANHLFSFLVPNILMASS